MADTQQDTRTSNDDNDAWEKIDFSDICWGSRACNVITIRDSIFMTVGGYAVHSYNIQTGKSKTYPVFNKNQTLVEFRNPRWTFNQTNQTFYIQDDWWFRIVKMNNQTDAFDVLFNYKFEGGDGRFGQRIMFIDGKCHCVGANNGSSAARHEIWNDTNNRMETICLFPKWPQGLSQYGWIFHKKKQVLILFGGRDWSSEAGSFDECNEDIMEYDLRSNKWTRTSQFFTPRCHSFGCSVNKCGFVIICGGTVATDMDYVNNIHGIEREIHQRSIFVAPAHNLKFTEIDIELPKSGPSESIIMEHTYDNQILVHGFVREASRSLNLTVPFALISLINTWHSLEFLYTFIRVGDSMGQYSAKWELWKISLKRILKLYS